MLKNLALIKYCFGIPDTGEELHIQKMPGEKM
jgi:hypothetical protein